MLANTKAYGKIEIDEKQLITFPKGILGFDKLKEFVLLDAQQQPFYYLQSLEIQEICFILIDPFLFRPDYEPDIDDEELKEIGIEGQSEAIVFAIVTVPQTGGPMTANLAGPLVVNRVSRLGRQAILQDSKWQTKHDIMDEIARSRKSTC